MSEEGKAMYKHLAQLHNATLALRKKEKKELERRNPHQDPRAFFRGLVAECKEKYREQYVATEGLRRVTDEIKAMLEGMGDREVANLPVVIINFGTYVSEPLEDILLAEVGITVFTIQNGIIDNFSALIDPGRAGSYHCRSWGLATYHSFF